MPPPTRTHTHTITTTVGVSCDACGKGSFSGKRYKCLVCYDFDLCAECYEAGETGTGRHATTHPMQCILTRVDSGNNLCSVLYSLVPRPHPLRGKGSWDIGSDFLLMGTIVYIM